jgi:S-adenosylmethionine synthetase
VKGDYIITSESVTIGHPDKLCDQVSDAIVDNFLMGDPSSSIAAECALSSGVMFISAHYTSHAKFDIQGVARDVIRDVGYTPNEFNADDCTILTSFKNHTASDYRPLDLDEMDNNEIDKVTAKHPATLFGYACDQTKALMPLPIYMAHKLAEQLDAPGVRKALPYLLPDGTAQVAIEYQGWMPKRIHSISLVTCQTDASAADLNQLRGDMIEHVIEPVLKRHKYATDARTNIFVNPEGLVIGGGPAVHSGLTGRKTGIDSYGEFARHSGAAMSGKDPLRIDRVGAYAARYAAKNLVAAGLASECEVQLSYTVGTARPISVHVRSFGTGEIEDTELAARLDKAIDFRLGAIVRDLRLHKLPSEIEGFYRKLAVYGQVGRIDLDVPWEKTDKVEALV